MADSIFQPMRFTIDLDSALVTQTGCGRLIYGDKLANVIEVKVLRGGKTIDLTGTTATGAFYRPVDGAEVPLPGAISANVVSVQLIDECYETEGHYEAEVKLSQGEVRRTILSIVGYVHRAGSGAVVNVTGVVPSIPELLAQISAMEAAAERANTAAARAEALAIDANGYAQNAKQLNGKDASEYTLKSEFNALVSGVEIVPTVSGSVIALNDASGLPLRGLTIYGKTTQNGTPTPDNPKQLNTAGDVGHNYVLFPTGNNLLNINCPTKTDTIINANSEFAANANWNCYRIPVPSGDAVTLSYTKGTSFDTMRYGLETNGVITRNGTGDSPKVFQGIDALWLTFPSGDDFASDVMVNVGNTAIAYEPYEGQVLALITTNGLPGIPVTSGGNYTDASGQRWICDEIDLERGVKIQRIASLGVDDFGSVKISSDPKWNDDTTTHSYEITLGSGLATITVGLCNAVKSYSFGDFYEKGIVDGIMNNQSYLVINLAISRGIDTVDKFKEWCGSVGLMLQKPLLNPIETALTDDEIAAYRALVTNRPNTTIYNDAGADMTVRYVADTQTYIDKHIGASAVAVNALMEGLTDE